MDIQMSDLGPLFTPCTSGDFPSGGQTVQLKELNALDELTFTICLWHGMKDIFSIAASQDILEGPWNILW